MPRPRFVSRLGADSGRPGSRQLLWSTIVANYCGQLLWTDLDYPVTAVFIVFDTVPNMVFSVLPMVVRAPMAATETRAAMRPYSMAVAPDSSPQKSLNHFNMIGSPVQRIVRGEYLSHGH